MTESESALQLVLSGDPGLLAIVRRHSYDPFVVYRLIVGVALLLIIATGARAATF